MGVAGRRPALIRPQFLAAGEYVDEIVKGARTRLSTIPQSVLLRADHGVAAGTTLIQPIAERAQDGVVRSDWAQDRDLSR